jgi:hypothetical protein
VPWRERAREVLARLRAFARDREPEALETFLRGLFGEPSDVPPDADLERAFDDYVAAPGSAGEGRSLARAFAEEAEGLEAEERRDLPRWETERRRRVYLLDRAARERLDLWDPLTADRVVLHLLERLPAARAAALERGAVVVASSAPWGTRQVAIGRLELYEEDEAIRMYRREVVSSGRIWNDLPPPAPTHA